MHLGFFVCAISSCNYTLKSMFIATLSLTSILHLFSGQPTFLLVAGQASIVVAQPLQIVGSCNRQQSTSWSKGSLASPKEDCRITKEKVEIARVYKCGMLLVSYDIVVMALASSSLYYPVHNRGLPACTFLSLYFSIKCQFSFVTGYQCNVK